MDEHNNPNDPNFGEIIRRLDERDAEKLRQINATRQTQAPQDNIPADIDNEFADEFPPAVSDTPTRRTRREEQTDKKGWWRAGWETFKTVAILFSFLVNLLLVLLVLWLFRQMATIQQTQVQPLVSGLYKGFSDLNNSVIEAQIPIDQSLPISFNVPVRQNTTVILVAPVQLENVRAKMDLGAAGVINGLVTLELPQGMQLPVAMDMTIPVTDSVPVKLNVDVRIPVNQTQLNQPFEELKSLVKSYDDQLEQLPGYTPVVPEENVPALTPTPAQ